MSRIIRLLAIDEKFRKAPHYLTPAEDPKKRGAYKTGQDLNWKIETEDGKKKFVLATDEDEKKAKKLALIIDPNESYMVKDKMQFDLDAPGDVIFLDFLKMQPEIIASKKSDCIPGRQRYYLENKDDEAQEAVTKMDKEYDAVAKIKAMNLSEKKDFARVLGVGKVDGLSEVMIQAALFERCKNSPALVLSTMEDPNYKAKSFLRKLIERNVIRFGNGKYTYGNEIMATNETAMLEFMRNKSNANLLSEWGRAMKLEEEAVTA
jgi:hypothetical protein